MINPEILDKLFSNLIPAEDVYEPPTGPDWAYSSTFSDPFAPCSMERMAFPTPPVTPGCCWG